MDIDSRFAQVERPLTPLIVEAPAAQAPAEIATEQPSQTALEALGDAARKKISKGEPVPTGEKLLASRTVANEFGKLSKALSDLHKDETVLGRAHATYVSTLKEGGSFFSKQKIKEVVIDDIDKHVEITNDFLTAIQLLSIIPYAIKEMIPESSGETVETLKKAAEAGKEAVGGTDGESALAQLAEPLGHIGEALDFIAPILALKGIYDVGSAVVDFKTIEGIKKRFDKSKAAWEEGFKQIEINVITSSKKEEKEVARLQTEIDKINEMIKYDGSHADNKLINKRKKMYEQKDECVGRLRDWDCKLKENISRHALEKPVLDEFEKYLKLAHGQVKAAKQLISGGAMAVTGTAIGSASLVSVLGGGVAALQGAGAFAGGTAIAGGLIVAAIASEKMLKGVIELKHLKSLEKETNKIDVPLSADSTGLIINAGPGGNAFEAQTLFSVHADHFIPDPHLKELYDKSTIEQKKFLYAFIKLHRLNAQQKVASNTCDFVGGIATVSVAAAGIALLFATPATLGISAPASLIVGGTSAVVAGTALGVKHVINRSFDNKRKELLMDPKTNPMMMEMGLLKVIGDKSEEKQVLREKVVNALSNYYGIDKIKIKDTDGKKKLLNPTFEMKAELLESRFTRDLILFSQQEGSKEHWESAYEVIFNGSDITVDVALPADPLAGI